MHTQTQDQQIPVNPGRFTRAAIHSEAGELELRLTQRGNWQLFLRADDDSDWRLACSGDLQAGAVAPLQGPRVSPMRFDRLVVDPGGRRALVDDLPVKLSRREFGVLRVLASEPERVFTKEELTQRVWGCGVIRSSHTLESHANRLRIRLRRAGAEGFVINCWGVGYKLWEGAPIRLAT
jgi:hypothetical protein